MISYKNANSLVQLLPRNHLISCLEGHLVALDLTNDKNYKLDSRLLLNKTLSLIIPNLLMACNYEYKASKVVMAAKADSPSSRLTIPTAVSFSFTSWVYLPHLSPSIPLHLCTSVGLTSPIILSLSISALG